MKSIQSKVFLTIILLLAPKQNAFAQSFVNLNFESAHIVPDNEFPYLVLASSALPGWTAGPLYGTQNNEIPYNTVSLGGPMVSIHDANDPGGLIPIQGDYSVYIQSGEFGPGTAGIWQTGQIPATAKSLTFWTPYASFSVTFNGQAITYAAIGSGLGYKVFGGDISTFAGQTGTLQFTGGGMLDNIQFSNQPIPEPSSLALFSIGAWLLGFFQRRNSSR